MRQKYPRIVIAGLRGGSGKTTLSLGLIASLTREGRKIVPFKKGPDYIDAGWLAAAAGAPCYNLDPFLIGREKIMSSFLDHFGGADCAVIEGNRGIYDGMDAEGTYSTAELAKMLRAPVVLVLDCTKVTRTAGAMVYGMQKFDRGVEIMGVVLNQIAGARHEKIIRESIEKYCGVPVLGAIPKLKKEFLSERHMGLTPFQEHPEVSEAISFTAETVKQYVDIERIMDMARAAKPLGSEKSGNRRRQAPEIPRSPEVRPQILSFPLVGNLFVKKDCGSPNIGDRHAAMTSKGAFQHDLSVSSDTSVRIGVIRDTAFQFYYPENFEELGKRGADIVEISALTERKLPDIDALYIGGGFPETNAIALAGNRSFRRSVREAVEKGLPVYAECGGLMYLGTAMILNGKKYSMAGVFPFVFSLGKKPQAHGYTIIEVKKKNPFYPKGTILRGHEFHYSGVINSGEKPAADFAFRMQRGQGIMDKRDGVLYKNVLATYTHLHAYGAPQWADGMIRQAQSYRKEKDGAVKKGRNNKTVRGT